VRRIDKSDRRIAIGCNAIESQLDVSKIDSFSGARPLAIQCRDCVYKWMAIGSISVLFLSTGPLTRGFFSENLEN
jgi:hypothetical protein